MNFVKNLFKNLVVAWRRTPVWFRKVFVNTLETGGIAVLVYVINAVDGGQSLSVSAMMWVGLKAMAQFLRVHPSVPLKDYVNDHK